MRSKRPWLLYLLISSQARVRAEPDRVTPLPESGGFRWASICGSSRAARGTPLRAWRTRPSVPVRRLVGFVVTVQDEDRSPQRVGNEQEGQAGGLPPSTAVPPDGVTTSWRVEAGKAARGASRLRVRLDALAPRPTNRDHACSTRSAAARHRPAWVMPRQRRRCRPGTAFDGGASTGRRTIPCTLSQETPCAWLLSPSSSQVVARPRSQARPRRARRWPCPTNPAT